MPLATGSTMMEVMAAVELWMSLVALLGTKH